MIAKEDICKIGYFGKPHGIKGEIGIITDYDLFEESEDPYIICEMDGLLVPFFIKEYRYKSNKVILVKMENIDSEEAAKGFVSRDVYYPADALSEEDATENPSWNDFIGYEVLDTAHGLLGKITAIDESTINILIQIDRNGNELLVPAAEEFILSVDHVKKSLQVSIPEGLLHL